MTSNAYGFESGSNGDTLTAELAWADPAGATIAVFGTGASAVISTARSAHGTRSAKFTAGSTSGACYTEKSISASQLAGSMYIYIDTLPSADNNIIWGGAGGSQRFSVELTSTGAIRFRDDTNGAKWNGTVTTSTGTIPTGVWTRVELYVTKSPTAATFRLTAYASDSSTALSGLDSGVMSGINTGTDTFTNLRYGAKASTNSNTGTLYVDDFDYNEAASGFIGPYVEALATPNATITNVTKPSSMGGSDGTVSISWPAVPGAAGYDVSVASGAAGPAFTPTKVGATSPYTFTGLSAGSYTVAVRATV